MRNADPLSNPLLNSVVCWFGGKSPSMPKQQNQAPLKMPETLAPVAPAPPPPPPPTESASEVQNRMAQQAEDAKKRRGMAASLLSGQSGSQGPTSSATGTGSLLG